MNKDGTAKDFEQLAFDDKDLIMFTITDLRLENRNEQVHMVISLKRKIQTEMLTTYLPTLLLLIITYATTFFKPIYFEASLTVNLTIMLVMTTIFTSKIEELPPTSDMKMIDVWLIFCLIVPFLEVILRTAIECMNCSCHICEQKDAEKKDEVWAVEASTVEEEVKEENLEVAGGKCWRRNWQSALCVTGEIAFQGRSCLQLFSKMIGC